MSRDWQKDMELAHSARYEYSLEHLNPVLDALFYWLHRYSTLAIEHAYAKQQTIKWSDEALAEKQRVDKLQEQLKSKTQLLRITDESREDVRNMYKRAAEGAAQEQERANRAEAREQKLREGITLYISEDMYRDDAEPFFEELLTSLYPKEGTK
jgi:hypothetical protein